MGFDQPFSDRDLDTFASVSERDIDMVLVMALRASARCRQLFAAAVATTSSDLVAVRHSVATEDGREADIELRLGTPGQEVLIEIENKLSALFQPGQAASYSARTVVNQQADGVEHARAVLVAPAKYLETATTSASEFDGMVSYEEVRDALLLEGDWSRTASLMVEHAIRQHRRGYKASPDSEARTRFFNTFADLAAAEGLPELTLGPRKPGAGFLWYPRHGTLTQPTGWKYKAAAHGAWLGAKFIHGHADIELTGISPFLDVDAVQAALSESDWLLVLSDAKSARLRSRAPVLDPDQSVMSQFDNVADFVQALVRIRDWWERDGVGLISSCLRAPPRA